MHKIYIFYAQYTIVVIVMVTQNGCFFLHRRVLSSPLYISWWFFYLKYISKTFLYNSLKLSNTRVVSADQTPDFEIQNPKYLCPMQSEVRLNKRYRLMPILGLS